MKIYLAGLESYLKIKEVFERALVSYFTLKGKDIKKFKGMEIFLDSGAFSAFTQGVKINIDEYIHFIKKYKNYWKVYATLDVIGNWKKTKENTEYMESKGLNPLPVFHYKSPEKELKRMCKKYQYIALGGLVPIARYWDKLRKWLDYCFSIIGTKTKVHGFGVTGIRVLKRYPFYSVDSTGWISAGKFNRKVKYESGVLKARRFGKGVHYLDKSKENIKQYQKVERAVTKLWRKRGIVWK